MLHPWLWSLTYLLGALVSGVISLLVFKRSRGSTAAKVFLLYGMFVILWLILIFGHRTAVSQEISSLLFRMSLPVNSVIVSLLFYVVLLIGSEKRIYILSLLPAIPQTVGVLLFAEVHVFPTIYGWSYDLKFEPPAILLFGAVHFAYVGLILIALTRLAWRTKLPTTRKKYLLFLTGFGAFQSLGFYASNMYLQLYPDTQPLGGLMQIAAFIIYSYAFSLKSVDLWVPRAEEMVSHWTRFSTFLQNLYVSTPDEEFGQKQTRFLQFAKRVGIDDALIFSQDTLELCLDRLQGKNFLLLLDNCFQYLEEIDGVSPEIQSSSVSLIEDLYYKAKAEGNLEPFREIILKHVSFLTTTDMLYGVAEGELLQYLTEDKSLDGLERWEACLKIYVRMLAIINRKVMRVPRTDLTKAKNRYHFTRLIEFGDNIRVDDLWIRSHFMTFQPEQRIRLIKESFNAFLTWAFVRLLELSPDEAIEGFMQIARVLRLNRARVEELNVYRSLVRAFTQKIPPKYMVSFFREMGFSYDESSLFSKQISTTIDEISGKKVLVEFKPRSAFEDQVRKFVMECLANGLKCVVFTMQGSKVHKAVSNIDGLDLYLLVATPTRGREDKELPSLPIQDTTRILDTLNMVTDDENTAIVFDNLSDIIHFLGFEKAYRPVRQMVELFSRLQTSPVMVLFNSDAHDKHVKSTIEGLFDLLLLVENDILTRL